MGMGNEEVGRSQRGLGCPLTDPGTPKLQDGAGLGGIRKEGSFGIFQIRCPIFPSLGSLGRWKKGLWKTEPAGLPCFHPGLGVGVGVGRSRALRRAV